MQNDQTQEMSQPARLPFLDALRGLAALSVVMVHVATMPNPLLETPVAAETLVLLGSTGVCLFFALSTYSLLYTMPARLGERRPFLSFYLRRFFRIAPLFYFWLAVRLLREYAYGIEHPLPEIAANVFFVFNLIPRYVESLVFAGWTVGVEEIFYVFFPVLFLLVRNLRSAFIFSAATVGLAYVFNLFLSSLDPAIPWITKLQTWSVLEHLPTFAMGSVAFWAARSVDTEWISRHRGVTSSAFLIAGVMLLVVFTGWPGVLPPHLPWQGILSALMMVGLQMKTQRLLVNPITEYLGRISFSFYLGHPILVFYLIPVYRRIYQALPNSTLGFVASVLVTCAILIPIAEITYRLIETRGINAGRNVYRWLTSREAERIVNSGSRGRAAAVRET